MINVIEATALTMEATKVGDVYFRLEKNMFSVKLPLQGQEKGDVDHANFLKKNCKAFFTFFLERTDVHVLTPEVTVQISPETA